MREPLRSQSGFTLVELLVVSVLLAVMSGILYGTLTGIMSGRQAIEGQRETSDSALRVLDGITRDLTSRALVALRTKDDSSGTSGSGGSGASGTAGGQNSFGSASGTGSASPFLQARGYFVGENKKEGDADADLLRFVANELPGDSPGYPPNYGLVEVSYRIAEVERDAVPEDFPTDRRLYQLVREEAPAEIQENDELVKKRSQTVVIADRVAGFNVRFMRNGKWEKQWQANSAPVPEAIEITLQMYDGEGEVVPYKIAVAVSKRAKARS